MTRLVRTGPPTMSSGEDISGNTRRKEKRSTPRRLVSIFEQEPTVRVDLLAQTQSQNTPAVSFSPIRLTASPRQGFHANRRFATIGDGAKMARATLESSV